MKCRRLQLILLPLSLHSILAAPQQGNAGQNKAGFDNDDVNAYDDDKETRKSKKVHTSREIALKHWMDDDDYDDYVRMLNMKIMNEAVKFFSLLCGVCTMHPILIESLKQNIRDLC